MTSAERPGLSPRARWLLPILLVAFVGLSVYRLGRPSPAAPPRPGVPAAPALPTPELLGLPDGKPALQELDGEILGTRYTVELAPSHALNADEQQRLEETVAAVVERIDGAMSIYRADSEINRLGQHRSPSVFRMSEDLAPVMRFAQEVSRESRGAFDVTVRPLVEAWGLGATGPRAHPPDERQLTELRSKVGYEKLPVGDHVLTKRHADLALDLSGIAPGYALDQLSKALTQAGYDNHRVAIGGLQRASGFPALGAPWEAVVGLRKVHLTGLGLATVGAQQAAGGQPAGAQLEPLIDPRTGHRVHNDLVAVTVVHSRAMAAHAWATALAVLGPVDGPKLARAQELAAFFLVRERSGRITPIATAEFEQVERGEYEFDAPDPPPDIGPVPAHDPGDVPGGDAHGP